MSERRKRQLYRIWYHAKDSLKEFFSLVAGLFASGMVWIALDRCLGLFR